MSDLMGAAASNVAVDCRRGWKHRADQGRRWSRQRVARAFSQSPRPLSLQPFPAVTTRLLFSYVSPVAPNFRIGTFSFLLSKLPTTHEPKQCWPTRSLPQGRLPCVSNCCSKATSGIYTASSLCHRTINYERTNRSSHTHRHCDTLQPHRR